MKKIINNLVVAPSLERADLLNLETEIKKLDEADVGLFHIDMMDRTYGDTIMMSPKLIPQIKKITTTPLDIHMYVSEPECYFSDFFSCCKNDFINLELEAVTGVSRLLQLIRSGGCRTAVSIEIGTPLSSIESIIEQLDLVNLLVRNNDFSDLPLMQSVRKRVSDLRKMADQKGKDLLIEVDGSIGFEDTVILAEAGANVMVYGSKVIFRNKDAYRDNLNELEEFLMEHM